VVYKNWSVYYFSPFNHLLTSPGSNDVSNAIFSALQKITQGVGRIEGAILVPGDCVADVPVTFTL
jgi:hypothetical protein